MQNFSHFTAAANDFATLALKATLAPSHTLTGWSLDDRNPEVIQRLIPLVSWFYRYYFRVKADGWEHVPNDGKLLMVGSHNGGLASPDTVMTIYDWFQHMSSDRPAYALMDPKMWRALPGVARLAAQVGALQAHTRLALQALDRDAAVLIYPGGVQDVFRPHNLRDRVCFFGHKGFIKLALKKSAPIVPVVSWGAHDTLIILADLYPQVKQLHQWGLPWLLNIDPGVFPIYLGLPWGLAVGPLPNIPLPIPLHIRVCPAIAFERYGDAAAKDHNYVDECYERVRQTMQQELDRLIQES